jgi:hypothetical protein
MGPQPVAAPSTSERTALLQQTLDLPQLAPFWHPGEPHRRPLRVVDNSVVHGAGELRLHGQAVQLGEQAAFERDGLPYFEFITLREAGDTVTIGVAYRVEGVVGEVTFRRQGGAWVVERAEIAER